jgi:hypothetical protein
MSTQVVERTSRGLVQGLFDAIDNLNQKKIDPEHARALSHTARTIVSVASLEMEFMKLQKDNGSGALKSLTITDESKDKK